MSRLRFLGGVVIVALAVLLSTTAPAQAQPHYGGWGQGGWGYGGWGHGYNGGYGGWGGYHRGSYPGYGSGYSSYYGAGFYPRYWGYTGYYSPSYYANSYPDYSYPSVYVDPGIYYSSNVVTGAPAPVTTVTTTQSLYYTPPTTTGSGVSSVSYTEPAATAARLHVRVPADATLWIDDKPTAQTGPERDFITPPLTPGRNYHYDMRARWMDNGKPVERTVRVEIRPNQTSQVDFLAPTGE
jgi:uncharacterized protein (TIGR03000 family)